MPLDVCTSPRSHYASFLFFSIRLQNCARLKEYHETIYVQHNFLVVCVCVSHLRYSESKSLGYNSRVLLFFLIIDVEFGMYTAAKSSYQ